ncbi:peptidase M16 [Raphidocelis subcapitata]|uniref:Peptidase M16 n=1 Tax=Raphidocelis subcapitata TaxID=307507 RepID=A0A2V0NZ64_9CHLO|nr:peptidase M16 [Raphidocelis subcapitata]|eukprot:GBF90105.1 peptidase M16 [Raphidocelis subcapitata]
MRPQAAGPGATDARSGRAPPRASLRRGHPVAGRPRSAARSGAVACRATAVGPGRRDLLLGGGAVAAALAGGATSRSALAAEGALYDAERLQRRLEARVTRFRLDNGLTFVVAPRPDAPVVSCETYVTAGAWVEEDGRTGVAHLLEHLAFKGTPQLGSRDWARESAQLHAVDEVFYALREARREGRTTAAAALAAQLEQLQARPLPSRQSEHCLATATCRYYVSLPANRLELWFALEAQRFQAPVFRELYREKEVVAEERASRVDNSPVGRLFRDFAERSLANPYRRPVLGFREDLEAMGRAEVADFFARYYHPRNTVIAIAGAATPEQVRRLAERYFGGWGPVDAAAARAAGPTPEALALEPSARPNGANPASGGGGGDSSSSSSGGSGGSGGGGYSSSSGGGGGGGGRPLDYAATSRAGPLLLAGYYRPSLVAPSSRAPALEAACDVLAAGRTSRLQALAREGRLLGAGVTPGYPGDLHAGMALVTARPRPGDSPQRAASLVQGELDRLAASGPTPAELARVVKGARAQLLGALAADASLAGALAAYEATTGSWRGLLRELAEIEGLSPGDVRDAAAATFDPANSVTALIQGERNGGGGGDGNGRGGGSA